MSNEISNSSEGQRALALRRGGASRSARALAKKLGLRLVAADTLSIRRRRRGKGWSYIAADQRAIRDPATLQRLARLAMPPAYQDVLYAEDPDAHLQAIGRDAAGRLQYRYHPDWEKVREMRKARRLARLAEVLPRIRRSIGQHLAADEPTREFASAAVIELVARSAIRPGSESYARMRGTRGAATLLKSNVTVYGETITLTFRSKGGKTVVKEFVAPRLATAIASAAPAARAADVPVSRRRTATCATSPPVTSMRSCARSRRTHLAQGFPHAARFGQRARGAGAHRAGSERTRAPQAGDGGGARRRRRSRQHARDLPQELRAWTVVAAFEDGVLERFSDTLKGCRSPPAARRCWRRSSRRLAA